MNNEGYIDYHSKYLKYKKKYLDLKSVSGGAKGKKDTDIFFIIEKEYTVPFGTG